MMSPSLKSIQFVSELVNCRHYLYNFFTVDTVFMTTVACKLNFAEICVLSCVLYTIIGKSLPIGFDSVMNSFLFYPWASGVYPIVYDADTVRTDKFDTTSNICFKKTKVVTSPIVMATALLIVIKSWETSTTHKISEAHVRTCVPSRTITYDISCAFVVLIITELVSFFSRL